MQLAYCLYSCNGDRDVNSSIWITSDCKSIVYSEDSLARLKRYDSKTVELRSKREVTEAMLKLKALGLKVIPYEKIKNEWYNHGYIPGEGVAKRPLTLAFKYGNVTKGYVVDVRNRQCGYVADVSQIKVDLVVNVKRKGEIDDLEWTMTTIHGFNR